MTAIENGSPQVPEPVDPLTALELRRSFAKALGFEPGKVTRVEFTARAIKVWTFDKETRRTDELILDTASKTPTPWALNRSTAYGHGDRLVRVPRSNG